MLDFTYKLHKDPIPAAFGYSVQRSDLETAAAGLELPRVAVSFNTYYCAADLQESRWLLPATASISLIQLRYWGRGGLSACFSRHQEKRALDWHLYVHPVPGKLRKEIREACKTRFLRPLLEWTIHPHAATWFSKNRTLSLLYSPENRDLSLLESKS